MYGVSNFKLLKELSLCNKIWFFNPYIFAIQCCWPCNDVQRCAMVASFCALGLRTILTFSYWFAIYIRRKVAIANVNFSLLFHCDFALLRYCVIAHWYWIKYPVKYSIPSRALSSGNLLGTASFTFTLSYVRYIANQNI